MTDHSKDGPKLRSSCLLLELNLRKILLLMAVLAVLGSVISGCSPFYVIRAAYEEGKILWRREPIPEYLEKPDLTAETQDKLKLVLADEGVLPEFVTVEFERVMQVVFRV